MLTKEIFIKLINCVLLSSISTLQAAGISIKKIQANNIAVAAQ